MAAAEASRPSPLRRGRKLLQEYSLGSMLGQGAFGVVRRCQDRKSGEEYAVKMVDRAEKDLPTVMCEAEMLKVLDHPNIMKFVDLFVEKCFVCIVVEIYGGGDLVDGLQRQGPFASDKIVPVAHQLASAIAYLHSQNIVHRDVKGDNYMMDRQDMLDPGIRVVLADFGTAAHVQPSEPFTIQCGTRQFWAPEVLDKKYGMKVDIWALGVLMYGLVTGRFPFHDENDIRKKDVQIRPCIDQVCKDYILSMLRREEANRPCAQAVVSHAYLSSMIKAEAGAAEESVADPVAPAQMSSIIKAEARAAEDSVADPVEDSVADSVAPAQMIREDGANVCIRDRCNESVDRLQPQHNTQLCLVRDASAEHRSFTAESGRCSVSGSATTGGVTGFSTVVGKGCELFEYMSTADPRMAEVRIRIFGPQLHQHGPSRISRRRRRTTTAPNLLASFVHILAGEDNTAFQVPPAQDTFFRKGFPTLPPRWTTRHSKYRPRRTQFSGKDFRPCPLDGRELLHDDV